MSPASLALALLAVVAAAAADDLLDIAVGPDCSHKLDKDVGPVEVDADPVVGVYDMHDPADSRCRSDNSTVCLYTRVNLFASETGYYTFDQLEGTSPEIHVTVGQKIVFEQYDYTNWFHPLGFAYFPDGAHGDTWGGDERDEVEETDQIAYFVNNKRACRSDEDIGLDCYEPEFFYPLDAWKESSYRVELTITPELAEASFGGVLYYFCHIHSKMSGKIILHNADGSLVTGTGEELPLYPTVTVDPIDATCGTYSAAPFTPGQSQACDEAYLCGDLDTNFEKCLQGIDCQMNREMRVGGHDDHEEPLVTFSRQMIPHHINAVNMAKLMLKMVPREELEETEFFGLMLDIINNQNAQIHQMRGYLGSLGDFPEEKVEYTGVYYCSTGKNHNKFSRKACRKNECSMATRCCAAGTGQRCKASDVVSSSACNPDKMPKICK